MTPQEFCYWLQGFFELSESNGMSPKQVEIVKEHLRLVFTKVTGNVPVAKPLDPFEPICSDVQQHVSCSQNPSDLPLLTEDDIRRIMDESARARQSISAAELRRRRRSTSGPQRYC